MSCALRVGDYTLVLLAAPWLLRLSPQEPTASLAPSRAPYAGSLLLEKPLEEWILIRDILLVLRGADEVHAEPPRPPRIDVGPLGDKGDVVVLVTACEIGRDTSELQSR